MSAAHARPCGVAGTTSVKRAGPRDARSFIAWTSSSEAAVRLAMTRTRSAALGRPVRWDMGGTPPSVETTDGCGDTRRLSARSPAAPSYVRPGRLATLDALRPAPLPAPRVALDEGQQREAH